MRCGIFRATCTCGWRRAQALLGANPLVALVALAACAAGPAAAAWGGLRLSAPFAAAAGGDPTFLTTLGVGVAVPACVAGLSVALLAPGPEALGPQIAAAPRARASLAAGAVVGPVCAAAGVLSLALLCFALPLAGSTGLSLVLLVLACGALGAALGESCRLLAAREARGAALLPAAASVWIAAGVPGDAPSALGPVGAIGTPSASAMNAAVVAAGLALWVLGSGVGRQARAPTRTGRLRRLPVRAGPAVALATARRVLRHPELRLHGITALVLPLGAAVAARIAFGLGGSSSTVFCVAVALTAAALYPPAALGLMRGAGWLLAAAPRSASGLAGAAVAGGVGAAIALVAIAAVAAAPLGPAGAMVYLELQGATAFVLGCAAFAGAIVPWHPARVLHQLASYAAVLAIVLAAWLAVGRLEALASTGPAFGVLAGNAVLLVGVGAAAAVSR